MNDFFTQLLSGSVFILIIYILILFFIFLAPALIIANAIKTAARTIILPYQLDVISDNDDHFLLEYNIIVYKKYFDEDSNLYVTPYGIFEPVYSSSFLNNNCISSFIYKK